MPLSKVAVCACVFLTAYVETILCQHRGHQLGQLGVSFTNRLAGCYSGVREAKQNGNLYFIRDSKGLWWILKIMHNLSIL